MQEEGLKKRSKSKDLKETTVQKETPVEGSALTQNQLEWLRDQIKHAEEKSKAYEAASSSSRWWNNNLNLILWLVLSMMGSSSVLYNTFNLKWEDANFGFEVTMTVFAVIAAVIQTLHRVWNVDEKMIKHHDTASGLKNFVREWKLQLVTGIDDRKEKCDEALIIAENQISEIDSTSIPL